jgi:predicted signal transduction protein with EAL and GGDEF domain
MIDILEQRAASAPPLTLVAAQFPRLSQVIATLGHEVAELVARAIAARLQSLGDVLPTRLGSDVFAFVLPDGDDAGAIARVVTALEEPYRVEGHTIVLYLVLGLTTSATAADDPAELMRQAEVALRVASQQRLSLARYDAAMSGRIKSRRLLDLALHHALERDELQLVFQPQVCLRTGVLLGTEALVRWHSAEHGDVSPAQFIPLAEESSLIAEIGTWVMREACRQAADWPWQGRLSVNVSAMQFRHGDLLADVTQALADSGFPAHRLDIEITESLCTQDDVQTLQTLRALRALGCSIAMDDFGTGYSSLSYLAQLPIDKIKIDQSFIRGLPALDNQVLVETAVSLGQRLGKVVIAEGVETDAQRAYLSSIGCDLGQGYYFGRPGPASELPFDARFAA